MLFCSQLPPLILTSSAKPATSIENRWHQGTKPFELHTLYHIGSFVSLRNDNPVKEIASIWVLLGGHWCRHPAGQVEGLTWRHNALLCRQWTTMFQHCGLPGKLLKGRFLRRGDFQAVQTCSLSSTDFRCRRKDKLESLATPETDYHKYPMDNLIYTGLVEEWDEITSCNHGYIHCGVLFSVRLSVLSSARLSTAYVEDCIAWWKYALS